MRSTRSFLIVSAAVLASFASGSQAQQQVYHWVDAKGVSHYADAPPEGQEDTARELLVRTAQGRAPTAAAPAAAPAAAGAAATASAGKPSNKEMCERARMNINALQGTQDVVLDADGDGKNELLDAAQRADQLKRAQAAVSYYCE